MRKLQFDVDNSVRKQGIMFNIRLDSTSRSKVLAYVRDFINKKRKFYVVTPNPEIFLMAQEDKSLLNAINGATLALPDGVGLAMADRFLKLTAPKNILIKIPAGILQGIGVGLSIFVNKKWLLSGLNILKGREVFMDLVSLANKRGWKTFLLGGKGSEAQDVVEKLKLNYKKVKFEYAPGPTLNDEAKPVSESDIKMQNDVIYRINNFKPQLLFVAFGAPKQEKWIYEWLPKLDIGGAMVVGGAFSYIAGHSKLPPKWMEGIGLEWVWRLIAEPWRAGRIIKASIVFPWKVFLYKLSQTNS